MIKKLKHNKFFRRYITEYVIIYFNIFIYLYLLLNIYLWIIGDACSVQQDVAQDLSKCQVH